MNRKTGLLILVALLLIVASVGCGATPPAATVTPASTLAPQVVTVVITATLPAATATTAQATITPLPTIGVATVAPTPPTTPTPAPTTGTPKPTATKKPTVAPVVIVPTNTTVPIKYGAPNLIGPVFDPNGRKDQLVVGNAMVLEWQATGPLGANECYLVRVSVNPGAADSFILCDSSVTQVGVGSRLSFILQRPGYNGINYAGLLVPNVGQATVTWSVQVVKNLGPGTPGAYLVPDGTRIKFAPLSPASTSFQFPLYGNQ